jgi:hypothetical protein
MMRAASLLMVSLVLLAGCGKRDRSGIDADALAKRPDTEVARRTEGDKQIVVIRRGGVVITEENGVVKTAVDNSGHGAVLCAWKLSVDIVAALDVCVPGQHPALRRDMADALDAIADFIVANSLTPVRKSELERYVNQRLADTERQRDASGKACSPEFLDDALPKLDAIPSAERRAETANLLAVPRPPVMEPCL